jgi:hypothetical protein
MPPARLAQSVHICVGELQVHMRITVFGGSYSAIVSYRVTSCSVLAEAYPAKREADLWRRSVDGAMATVALTHVVVCYLPAERRSEAIKILARRLLDELGTRPLGSIYQESS